MKFFFTRHSERRIKLYGIDREGVEKRLNTIDKDALEIFKKVTFIFDGIVSKVNKPIKVILVREVEEIVIISIYPLRKELRK